MILVLMGTNPYPFDRLGNAVVKLAQAEGERIIVQSGNTLIKSSDAEVLPFVEHDTILDWIKQADVVISQGGFGSLQDCIQNGANVVAVPRKYELGESVDDQVELVKALADEGLVVPVYDIDNLSDAVKRARQGMVYKSRALELQESIAKSVRELWGAGL